MRRHPRHRDVLDRLVPLLRPGARRCSSARASAFREIKVDEDADERDAMLKRTGGRRTVPQIFIGDRHVGGYDDLYALDKTGELDKLLGRA